MKEHITRAHLKYPDLWKAQDGKCFYCAQPMLTEAAQARHPRLVTRDHFIPAAYGAQRYNNIVLACTNCNRSSGHQMPSLADLERFIALYETVGRNYQSVHGRLHNWWNGKPEAA